MSKHKTPPPERDNCAVIYARYSSHAQNDDSIEQQVEECRTYAAANGLRVLAVYADRAMTGRSDKRPEFQRMMRAAEKHEFQTVIAYKSNRISRNMLHALSYEDKLACCGVSVIYCKEEFGNTAAGRFALRTMMNVNQFYCENMAEDIMRGMQDNAKQCRINGAIAYGYKKGADGKYEIDEETAPIIREIFRRTADGESRTRIATSLNARGILTARGRQWGKHSFQTILHNERYIGIYEYNGVRITGGVPAIVDTDLYQAVQLRENRSKEITLSRRRRDDMEYLLTGKLFCGHCNTPMVGTSGTGKSGTMYYYYRCKNNAEKHICPKKPVRKEVIERIIVQALYSCVTNQDTVEWMTDLVVKYRDSMIEHSDLDYLTARLSEIKTSIHNLMKAIEAGIITDSTKARLEELEAEKKEVTACIAEEKRAIPKTSRDHIAFYFNRFKDGDVNSIDYQRLLIKCFLKAAYIYDNHLKVYFSYADDEAQENGHCIIPLDPDTVGLPDTLDVLISPLEGYHTITIRTPSTLRIVGQVFLLSIDFQ